jgi:hypothetical protein
MKYKASTSLGYTFFIASILITGCSSNINQQTSASISPTATSEIRVTQPSNPPVIIIPIKSDNATPTKEKSGDQATVANNVVQHADADSKDEDLSPKFNVKQPEIMGLSVGELQEKVLTQYGKPIESYVMDDQTEPLTVYAYEGFSVGFNSGKEIQFIDVSSVKVNPGLSGIRLGQSSAQALEILGKPDKNTSYVVSYNTKTAILKLDIDPKTKTIQSIKLFKVNEN